MAEYTFPKIDLHCHLDGAIAPETMLELGLERKLDLPARTVETLRPFVVCDPDCRSVNEYLTKFALPTMILQDREALARVAYELIVRSEAQGLSYLELRFAPQLHTRGGLSQRQAVEAVEDGVRIALKSCRTLRAGILLCAMCVGAASENRAENLETVRLAEACRDDLVRGFDLAGAEGLCPLRDFGELFARARAAGVPFTCHAGDSRGAETVRTAMLEFGASRIGHGHRIAEDPALCRIAAERGTTLEICLTSNVQCETEPGYARHPAKALLDMGIHVTLNTDNPVIAGVDLDAEYAHALGEGGFAQADLAQMSRYAAQAAFCEPETRAALLRAAG